MATRKKKPLWTCPKCRHKFVTRNMWHSCGRFRVTDHFKGNAPGRCSLEWCDAAGADAQALQSSAGWQPLLGETPLQPHARHAWDVSSGGAATHIRLNIFPDGGVARLRVLGAVA